MKSLATGVLQQLRAWSVRDGVELLREIAAMGSSGGALLASELQTRSIPSERVLLIAALGDSSGGAGIAELRSAATEAGPHTMDIRCAAVLAMTKRLHDKATDDLIVALKDQNRTVRNYAITCLAAYGNSSAWEDVLGEFIRQVRLSRAAVRRSNRHIVAITYLLRTGSHNDRTHLSRVLVEHWNDFDPTFQAQLLNIWPGLAVGRRISERAVSDAVASFWHTAGSLFERL